MVEPDTYIVAKDGRGCCTRVGHQEHADHPWPDGEEERRPRTDRGRAARLSDDEILEIARLGLAVEEHYGTPQDIEWAMAGGETYLVQSRPITTLGTTARTATEQARCSSAASPPPPAAPPVWCAYCLRPIRANCSAGEVLVAPMTSPDWVPAMRRAARSSPTAVA